MLEDLRSGRKVVGIKQLRKAVSANQVKVVFLADNADPSLTDPVRRMCRERDIPVVDVPTMAELGRACGISVSASAAGLM